VVVDNGGPGFYSVGAWQPGPLGYGASGALFAPSQPGATGLAPYDLGPLNEPAVAVWRPELPRAGRYRVLAFVPPFFLNNLDDATDMRYRVRFAGGEAEVGVDASRYAEWTDLGTYSFDPAQAPQVSLGSLARRRGLSIWADAVAFQLLEE
jgi:hypothetical protein